MLESSSQKFLQGLVYLIGNLMGLALAVYKCQSMGLLPTHASDWLAFIEPPEGFIKSKRGKIFPQNVSVVLRKSSCWEIAIKTKKGGALVLAS